MERCPNCGCDSLFVHPSLALLYDGKILSRRQEAYCNSVSCPARFWWYPETGRITRRNTGPVSKYYHPGIA